MIKLKEETLYMQIRPESGSEDLKTYMIPLVSNTFRDSYVTLLDSSIRVTLDIYEQQVPGASCVKLIDVPFVGMSGIEHQVERKELIADLVNYSGQNPYLRGLVTFKRANALHHGKFQVAGVTLHRACFTIKDEISFTLEIEGDLEVFDLAADGLTYLKEFTRLSEISELTNLC